MNRFYRRLSRHRSCGVKIALVETIYSDVLILSGFRNHCTLLQVMNHSLTQIDLPTYHKAQNQPYLDQIGNLINLHWHYRCGKRQRKTLFLVGEHKDSSPGNLLLLGVYDSEGS